MSALTDKAKASKVAAAHQARVRGQRAEAGRTAAAHKLRSQARSKR